MMVLFGSSHQKKRKKSCKVRPALEKLSGSAHVSSSMRKQTSTFVTGGKRVNAHI